MRNNLRIYRTIENITQQELAEELGVRNNVHFVGFRTDIKSFYAEADVFVFPSYREGLPVALMEAMAAGVPAVASRIRGNVDLIEDGVNGFLCNPSDEKSFADHISMLLSDDALASSFSERSKEKIKNYDTENVLRATQEIYKSVLEQ